MVEAGTSGPPVVARDALDEADYAEVVAGSERVRALEEAGARLLPGFRALLLDLFCALVKLNVVVAPRERVAASALVRWRVVSELVAGEGFNSTRRVTALRPEAAGYALLRIGGSVLESLRRGELLAREELRDAWRLAFIEDELEQAKREVESAELLKRERPDWREVFERGRQEREAARREAAQEVEALAERLGEALDGVPRRAWTEMGDAAARAGESLESLEGVGRGEGAAAIDPGEGGEGGGVDALALQAELVDLPGVKRLLRLLGGLREEARAARRKRAPRARTEVYGVERGDDLARLLPVELAQLRHPVLKREFRRRLVERRLLSYRVRGDERQGRGPAIFLLDVSGSMAGKKVVWAKAIVLTLADLARRARRRVTVISFSSGAARRRLDLALPRRGQPALRFDPRGLMAVSKLGTGGGTDFDGPLRDAMALIDGERVYRRADIVIVTDGEAHLSGAFVAELRSFKESHDTRFVGILIDVADHQRGTLNEFCDELVSVRDLSLSDARKVFSAF